MELRDPHNSSNGDGATTYPFRGPNPGLMEQPGGRPCSCPLIARDKGAAPRPCPVLFSSGRPSPRRLHLLALERHSAATPAPSQAPWWWRGPAPAILCARTRKSTRAPVGRSFTSSDDALYQPRQGRHPHAEPAGGAEAAVRWQGRQGPQPAHIPGGWQAQQGAGGGWAVPSPGPSRRYSTLQPSALRLRGAPRGLHEETVVSGILHCQVGGLAGRAWAEEAKRGSLSEAAPSTAGRIQESPPLPLAFKHYRVIPVFVKRHVSRKTQKQAHIRQHQQLQKKDLKRHPKRQRA